MIVNNQARAIPSARKRLKRQLEKTISLPLRAIIAEFGVGTCMSVLLLSCLVISSVLFYAIKLTQD